MRAQKRRRKWKKKLMKTKKRTNNVEDSLLEDAWEAMSRSNLEEDRFTATCSNMGSGGVVHMDTRSLASMDLESVSVETGSVVMAHRMTGTMMDPPGSVAGNNLRGTTNCSRSRQQEETRYRLPPPTTIHTNRPSTVARLHHDSDDASVYSQLTGSTMTFARPSHLRVARKVPVNEMDDEFQLEEAFIDAEIIHAKERRQMASSGRGEYYNSSGAPRRNGKSSSSVSSLPSSKYGRVSDHGIVRTNSRGRVFVASNNIQDQEGCHGRHQSGSHVLSNRDKY
jgi:hypothetical protein